MKESKVNKRYEKLTLIGMFFIFLGFILVFPLKEASIRGTFEKDDSKAEVIIDNPKVELIVGGILSFAIGIAIILYVYLYGRGKYILPHKNQRKKNK